MSISAADVKEIRELTGAGMMDCKKALEETAGDKQKAIDYLRTKGLSSAAKKQGRIAAEGLILTKVQKNQAVIIEVNCETDFVAKNIDFVNYIENLSNALIENKIGTVEELLAVKFNGESFSEIQNGLVLKIGEKIALRRFQYLSSTGWHLSNYTHSGKIGVLLAFSSSKPEAFVNNSEFAMMQKDICLHIAASDTKFISSDEMDETFKNKEAEIYAAQLKEQGKDEKMIPNIVKGKLSKLASEVCLLDQKFVKNPDITIQQLLNDFSKKSGSVIKIEKYIKYTLGEGIEKKVENFADEVNKMKSGQA